jgi:FkbH-like protein
MDERLQQLWSTGELAARYDEVAGLLTDLDQAGLRRAGTLLSRVDVGEVLAHRPDQPVVNVAVLGSSSLQPLRSPLTAQLARHGFLAYVTMGGYRQYTMELLDPGNPVFDVSPDLTLCLLDAEDVFSRLSTPWSVDDVVAVLDDYVSTISSLVETYLAAHTAPLVLNTIPLTRHWAAQLIDYRSKTQLGIAWREFNARLLRLGIDHAGVFVVDTEPLVAAGGPLSDPRLAAYTKIQYSDDFLAGYAKEIGHLVRALRGRTSKCLVLDLDGTVWGGILAEDGPTGIVAGEGHLGEAFSAFQKAAKQLAAQGPLLTVCSKNDLDLVQKALRENANLSLREDDLVALVANWGAKPDNLKQIAEQLNIGVDSLVFVDDSASERGLVRTTLPNVAVVAVNADEPALHLHNLLADGWFTTQQVTAEDKKRGQMYRTERKRLEFRERADSLTDYLAGLGTTVDLYRPDGADAGRIAQITQRTNQFNLTTVRLDVAEVEARLADPDSEVLAIRCSDRFGDHGTVGVVFLKAHRIENFLLSCRVLARGVEGAVLHTVLARAREAGATAVTAAYQPTAKNGKVADLYPRHGFRETETGEFVHDLTELPPAVPHVDIRVLTGVTS